MVNKKKAKKVDIIYGDVDLDKDEFSKEHAKVRITTMIDLDLLEALKREARKNKSKYQTILNQKLREILLGSSGISFNDLIEKVKRLERKVG